MASALTPNKTRGFICSELCLLARAESAVGAQLCTDDADWITGQTIASDGGWSARGAS